MMRWGCTFESTLYMALSNHSSPPLSLGLPFLQLEKTIRLLRERLTEKQTVAMELKTKYNLS